MRVIITGLKGYIAKNLNDFLTNKNYFKTLKNISVRDLVISDLDLNHCDIVIHTAAIVHKSKENYHLNDYIRINADLTYQLASKAKDCGVKKFIFISSINVYGINSGLISSVVEPNPNSFYGISKLIAEKQILKLQDANFEVLILRIPMVYGKNAPGNFETLRKYAVTFPFFGKSNFQRSFIFIDNLCSFIYQAIRLNIKGIYLVKDNFDLSSTEIFIYIKKHFNKVYVTFPLFNLFVWIISRKIYSQLFSSLLIDYEYLFSQKSYSLLTKDFVIDPKKAITSSL
jgi:UDP-glucose 4-epimerase